MLTARCESLCSAESIALLKKAFTTPPPYCLVTSGKIYSAQNTTQDDLTLVDVKKTMPIAHVEGLPTTEVSIFLNNIGLVSMNKTLAYSPSGADIPATTLNLQNNSLTQVNLTTLPPSLTALCLGGNNISIILASSAAFEVLLKLTQPHMVGESPTASVCDASTPFASKSLETSKCPPSFKLEKLWDIYPICVAPSPSSVDSSKSGASMVVVSVALALITLLLLAICIQRRRARLSPNWYEEVDHKYYGVVDAAQLDSDVRFDEMYAPFHIPAPSIERHHVLARGGFGIVYLATLHPSPAYPIITSPISVAMKRMLPEKASEVHSVEDFMEEIRLSARLYHKNIVKFIGFSWTTLQNLCALTEYMEHGDLWNYIQAAPLFGWNISKQVHVRIRAVKGLSMFSQSSFNNSMLSLDPKQSPMTWVDQGQTLPVSKFTMLCDVVEALMYLHSMDPPIIHRDLKTKNVLLNGVGVAKLTDFGVSRETSEDTMTAEIGTVAWIAPEVLKGIYYSEKADIYSLGVLMSEMDTAEVPYSNLDQIFPEFREPMDVHTAKTRIAMLVVAGDLRPSFTHKCPSCIVDVASRCLSHDPDRRPHVHEVWDWLKQIKKAILAAAAAGV
ncbi:hypothetical protein DYB32_002729 [Aphanomyces invadans]|uniref:Protein kinase domain-containing protein n=1 Tax=Aphanomyces invadans TaxID=157072 RepID=A0A418B2J6_9STRA|nr:hypothetical protein DYB32_002729 [Aphanomyces invadans]